MNLKHNSAYNYILRRLQNVIDFGPSSALHWRDKHCQGMSSSLSFTHCCFGRNICSPSPCTAVRLGTLPEKFSSYPSAPWGNLGDSSRPSSNVTSSGKFSLLLRSSCTHGKGKSLLCGPPSMGSNLSHDAYLGVLCMEAAKYGGYELRLGTRIHWGLNTVSTSYRWEGFDMFTLLSLSIPIWKPSLVTLLSS